MRITPAHAGKRNRKNQFGLTSRDHPRTRGEKCQFLQGLEFGEGSPPHTRGKGVRHVVAVGGGGITPAHAGKSPSKPRRAA